MPGEQTTAVRQRRPSGRSVVTAAIALVAVLVTAATSPAEDDLPRTPGVTVPLGTVTVDAASPSVEASIELRPSGGSGWQQIGAKLDVRAPGGAAPVVVELIGPDGSVRAGSLVDMGFTRVEANPSCGTAACRTTLRYRVTHLEPGLGPVEVQATIDLAVRADEVSDQAELAVDVAPARPVPRRVSDPIEVDLSADDAVSGVFLLVPDGCPAEEPTLLVATAETELGAAAATTALAPMPREIGHGSVVTVHGAACQDGSSPIWVVLTADDGRPARFVFRLVGRPDLADPAVVEAAETTLTREVEFGDPDEGDDRVRLDLPPPGPDVLSEVLVATVVATDDRVPSGEVELGEARGGHLVGKGCLAPCESTLLIGPAPPDEPEGPFGATVEVTRLWAVAGGG